MQITGIEEMTVEALEIGTERRPLLVLDDFLLNPGEVIEIAALQKFAVINPYYPGVRAPLSSADEVDLCAALSPLLSEYFSDMEGMWRAKAWYSIVTAAPEQLLPIQRLPHVDGTDARQIALMLYLHRTPHGGTGFYRHEITGFESLTEDRYPLYKQKLEQGVAEEGMPPAAYIDDGAPLFSRIHTAEGLFNRAILYHGNSFHSGVINNDSALPADPRTGRLTLNAFLSPPED